MCRSVICNLEEVVIPCSNMPEIPASFVMKQRNRATHAEYDILRGWIKSVEGGGDMAETPRQGSNNSPSQRSHKSPGAEESVFPGKKRIMIPLAEVSYCAWF